MGQRLQEYSGGLTKGLIPVRGRELVHRVLDFIELLNINKVLVIGGYQCNELRECIQTVARSIDLELLENRRYRDGNLWSLLTALDEMVGRSYYIFNVDHLFPAALVPSFIDGISESTITVFVDCHRQLAQDDMKVFANEQGRVVRISKHITTFNYGYIGVSHIPRSSYHLYRKHAYDLSLSTEGKNSVEDIIGSLAAAGHPVQISVIPPVAWFEIDTYADFLEAEANIGADER